MDLRQFGKKIRVTGDTVQDNAGKLARKVGLAVDAAVVLATPVDTGRARSNWQVEIGAAPAGTVPPFAEGQEGSTAGANAQAAIEAGSQAIAQYKEGETIHITNNLSYIGRLNEGWSAQAPEGYVETAVQAGVQQIRGAKITVTNGVK